MIEQIEIKEGKRKSMEHKLSKDGKRVFGGINTKNLVNNGSIRGTSMECKDDFLGLSSNSSDSKHATL